MVIMHESFSNQITGGINYELIVDTSIYWRTMTGE